MTSDLQALLNCKPGRATYVRFKPKGGSHGIYYIYLYLTKESVPIGVLGFSLPHCCYHRDMRLKQLRLVVPKPGTVIETEVGRDRRLTPAEASKHACDKDCRDLSGLGQRCDRRQVRSGIAGGFPKLLNREERIAAMTEAENKRLEEYKQRAGADA